MFLPKEPEALKSVDYTQVMSIASITISEMPLPRASEITWVNGLQLPLPWTRSGVGGAANVCLWDLLFVMLPWLNNPPPFWSNHSLDFLIKCQTSCIWVLWSRELFQLLQMTSSTSNLVYFAGLHLRQWQPLFIEFLGTSPRAPKYLQQLLLPISPVFSAQGWLGRS